jgi:hypothetical protein
LADYWFDQGKYTKKEEQKSEPTSPIIAGDESEQKQVKQLLPEDHVLETKFKPKTFQERLDWTFRQGKYDPKNLTKEEYDFLYAKEDERKKKNEEFDKVFDVITGE